MAREDKLPFMTRIKIVLTFKWIKFHSYTNNLKQKLYKHEYLHLKVPKSYSKNIFDDGKRLFGERIDRFK